MAAPGNNAGEERVWTSEQAASWYSANLDNCGVPCAGLTDLVSRCSMNITATSSLAGLVMENDR
jgi:hypothetical protein